MVNQLLADAETVRNWISGLHLAVTIALGLGLYWLGTKARKVEKLEAGVHEMTDKLIDERMRRITHQVDNSINSFLLTMEEMKQRLQHSETDFRGLGERDQKIELSIAAKFDGLKDYLRENFANKKDLEKHEGTVERKFEAVQTQVSQLASNVAVLNDRVKGDAA